MPRGAVQGQRELPKSRRAVYPTILVYVFVISRNNPLRTKDATMLEVYVFSGGSGTEAGGLDVSITSTEMYVLAVPDLPRSQHESFQYA